MSFPTIFYFPSTAAAPPISPAFHSIWDYTASATRLTCGVGSKGGTGAVAVSLAGIGGVGGSGHCLIRQYVSPPFAAVNLTAFSTIIPVRLGPAIFRVDTDADATTDHVMFRSFVLVRLCDSTGAIKSNPVVSYNTTTEPNWPKTTMKTSAAYVSVVAQPTALTTIPVAAGDCWVFELGFYSFSSGSGHPSLFNGTMEFRDDIIDLPNTNNSTAAGSPWIQMLTNVSLVLQRAATGPRVTYSLPLRPVHAARRFQYPAVADRSSTILNEFIAGGSVL